MDLTYVLGEDGTPPKHWASIYWETSTGAMIASHAKDGEARVWRDFCRQQDGEPAFASAQEAMDATCDRRGEPREVVPGVAWGVVEYPSRVILSMHETRADAVEASRGLTTFQPFPVSCECIIGAVAP